MRAGGLGSAAAVHRPSRRRVARDVRARDGSPRTCSSTTRSRSPRRGRSECSPKPDHFRRFLGHRARAPARAQGWPQELHRGARRSERRRGDRRRRRRVVSIPYSEINEATCSRGAMTKEIVEAVGVLEREKGISADRLMAALEDAPLGLQEDAGRGQVRARGGGPRQRRLPRVRADPADRPRGAAARRGRGGGRRADGGSRDRRAGLPRGARDRSGAADAVPRPDRRDATSRRRTSAASRPRRPSR